MKHLWVKIIDLVSEGYEIKFFLHPANKDHIIIDVRGPRDFVARLTTNYKQLSENRIVDMIRDLEDTVKVRELIK